ncbi:YjcZ family sporulation protein [Paenibacillus tianmuensis]|nr:YjcZ family sporulation protein [Paenibacillus tianmuensis]
MGGLGVGGSGFTSTGVILVLFILLVIVACSICFI